MTDNLTPLQREAFEAFFSDHGKWPVAVERSGEGYKLAAAQSAWVAWQGCCAAIEADRSARGAPQQVAQPSEPEQAAQQTQAAIDVLAERQRQISAEGWTPEHDDEHDKGVMAAAAACYALHTEPVGNVRDYLKFWPFDASWWKPGERRRNLIKAGALILAEIERLDRAAEPQTKD